MFLTSWFQSESVRSAGIAFLRIATGLALLLGHGLGKLMAFNEKAATFPDPLHVGSMTSMVLVIFAEFFCAGALALGFLTRLCLIPLMINMAVAAFVIHAADPWGKKELAFMYLVPFVTLFLTGPGRYSLDHSLFAGRMGSTAGAKSTKK